MLGKITTKTLVSAALLAAMSIILARFAVIWITPSVRVSFGNIPIIISGIMFGPAVGMLVGAVADIIGATVLSPFGWYAPLTVGPMLMGAIPALMRPLLYKKCNYLRVGTIVLTSNVIASMAYMTFVLSGYYGNPIGALLAVRIPLYIGISVVEALVVTVLLRSPLMSVAGVRLTARGE